MSSERQLLESGGGRWWGEHVHRYKEALKYIGPDDTVLDIACGTGFGTDILAKHTRGKAIGGDISAEAVADCKKQWTRPNIEFRVLDGTGLDFPDGFFDTIVSFETIEHTTSYRKMLSEFARVLKPSGKLILSTPNAAITSPDGVIHNPYHTQEFRLEELRQLLKEVFPAPEIFGQRYNRYDKKSLKRILGNFFEKLFLSFGIRKLPYGLRSGFMKTFFGYPLYPEPTDFLLEPNEKRIQEETPVLFAVCKK
jgi:ubiquinone/menaquinone biosynthesis C-methylase UbiE